MQGIFLRAIVLAVQILSVFYAKGQEQGKDTILIPRSMQDKWDLQLQPALPSLQLVMPELWNGNNNLRVIPFDKQAAIFNFKQELRYPDSLSEETSSLFLPAYPGLGDYQNFGGTLGRFNVANKLAFDFGAFISKQCGYLFSARQIVLGGNFLMRYAITNKLHLQTWGQFVTPGNSSDPTFNMRTFFPTTNFGTGLQYDSNKKTKINVGIEYQYDQSDKTWKPESGAKVLLKF